VQGSADDIAAAIDETGRLSALVADLLQLARAEKAAEAVPVDLVGVARDRVDTWSAVADAAGVALDLTAPSGPVIAAAVPNGVEQILDNLIDNALTAAPRGTHVAVRIVPGRGEHTLVVADEGPGLSDELKVRALDRFWRLDGSRPGTGLGLPIAQALAQASGGWLTLHDGDAGGLAVTVTLPATDAPPPRGHVVQGGSSSRRVTEG
jgi:signal transduction histidine kinase